MTDIAMRILLSAQDNASKVISAVFQSARGSVGGLSGVAGIAGAAIEGIGAIAIGVGVASVKMAADYQQSMNKVQALTGASAQQMSQYDSAIKSLAVDAGVAPKDLTDGLYNVISAGYSGKQAMDVLTLATKDAKIGMTDAAVTSNALTIALAAFKIPAKDFDAVNGEMLRTVTAGKMSMQDYASAISKTSSVAVQYKDSMSDMNAVLATLTSSGIKNANVAGTDYNNLLKVLNGSTDSVIKKSEALNPAFDGNAFKTMSLADKVDYLNKMITSQGHNITDVIGRQQNAAAAYTMLSTHMDMYRNNLKNLSNQEANAKATQDAWAVTQSGFNQQMSRAGAAVQVLMINIGNMLLPVLTRLVSSVTPIITAFTNWVTSGHAVSDVLGWMHDHLAIVIPIVSIFAGVLLATLVPAILSLAAGVIAATWPFVLIGAAIAGAVLIFQHFYATSKPFKAFIDNLVAGFKQLWTTITTNFMPAMQQVGDVIRTRVWPILQQVGSFITSSFKPVWDQLVSTFNGQVRPAFASIISSLQPLLPVLEFLGKVIGGIVGGAIILVISLIGGFIRGFTQALQGVIQFFGGLITFFSGVAQVIGGVVQTITDLVHGRFDKLGADLHGIMDGIGTMFRGAWGMIQGIWNTATGWITGLIGGFKDTIVGIFNNLSNILVGHSIIPDMVNAIVQFFTDLPGRAGSALSSILGTIGGIFSNLASQALTQASNLVSGVVNWLSQLPGRAGSAISGIIGTITGVLGQAAGAALNAGANIVNSIADGIRGAIGAVGDAIGAVAGFISSHLPHSPAKIGPLRDLVLQGSLIARQISDGLMQGAPYLSNALQRTLAPVASIGTQSPDSGVMADQLSFAGAPALIYSGTKKPVETTSAKKAQENRLKAAEKTVANEFKAIDAEMKALTKREATKEANERKRYAAEIKAIEAHDKHLSGNAKKAGEEEIKMLRAQEKRQLADERKAFEAKIRADRTKEKQLKQEIHLQLTVHAYKADASEIDRIAEQAVKAFGDKIRQQFGNI